MYIFLRRVDYIIFCLTNNIWIKTINNFFKCYYIIQYVIQNGYLLFYLIFKAFITSYSLIRCNKLTYHVALNQREKIKIILLFKLHKKRKIN